jgi:GNAT superfamily N-acetyltransferase
VRDLGATPPGDVLSFIDAVLGAECGLSVRDRLERSVADYYARFEPEGRFFRALYRDGALCALVAVDRYGGGRGTLKWVFVGPADRNRGLGSWLLDEAIAFARSAGYRLLILCTMTRMAAARHLYAKKGFVFRQDVTYWGRPMQVYENDLRP